MGTWEGGGEGGGGRGGHPDQTLQNAVLFTTHPAVFKHINR